MSKSVYRPRRLGPGSLVTVFGLFAFGLFGYLSQPGPVKTQYYEADGTGQLKLVDRPSKAASSPKISLAALKPEPHLILGQSNRLGLSRSQQDQLAEIDRRWSSRKATFLMKMEKEQRVAQPEAGTRSNVQSLSSGLSEYSRLSAEYNLERAQAWQASLNVLDQHQLKRLDLNGGVR